MPAGQSHPVSSSAVINPRRVRSEGATPRVYLRLRREGWTVNRKRVYRIYREAGLAVRRRKRKRIGAVERKPLPKPVAANLSWSMDFVSDGLADGRRLRCLTVVDDCTREGLAIEGDTSLTGTRVKNV